MHERIPEQFRADVVRRIGHGGEATVYELSGDRVLRVHHHDHASHATHELAAFYDAIADSATSFALPQILEQGEDGGIAYSVDRLIRGRPMHELMPSLAGDDRERALASYTDAVFEIASVPLVRDEYGEFLRGEDSIRATTWNDYLLARMRRSLEGSLSLRDDVPAIDNVVAELTNRIEALAPAPKALVHGDYFPGNVLLSDDLAVAGVIDFGSLTVIGDLQMDLLSALIFLEVARAGYTAADTEFVRERLVARAGPGILDAVTTYRGWYAIRFAPSCEEDENLYAWCVSSLNRIGEALAV